MSSGRSLGMHSTSCVQRMVFAKVCEVLLALGYLPGTGRTWGNVRILSDKLSGRVDRPNVTLRAFSKTTSRMKASLCRPGPEAKPTEG